MFFPPQVIIQLQNNLNLFYVATKKEGEPCGSCFMEWCPDSCKDSQCGDCEKGLECKQVSELREPPGRCKKITRNHT